MIASALTHLAALVHGAPSRELIFAGFCITGTVICSRFTGIAVRDILLFIRPMIVTVSTATAVFAGFVSQISGLPVAQVWIAFAPGGVEAMAAIGLAMGFDPTYVGLHHLVRITFMIFLLPLLIRR